MRQILEATNRVPDKIRSGSFEAAKNWKATASKWRKKAEGGVQKISTPKLEVLLAEARQALQQIRAE